MAEEGKEAAAAETTYRGPKAPVTCIALGGKDNKTIFAGSWDKDIWSWDVGSSQPRRNYSGGHSDFVKCVQCARIAGVDVLISGGADKKITVWDVETGRVLHTMLDTATTMLAVQFLALDPVLSSPDEIVFASASSDPHIRRWKATLDRWEQIPESFPADKPQKERLTIEEHHTSVYKLLFDTDGADVDLWTASADGTAKCLSRCRNFVADESYLHGDYVRAVQVTDQWIFTAGRDETIKVWNRATGKLHCSLEGHFEEITDLILLRDAQGHPEKLCSVSIDRTIRTWPIQQSGLDALIKEMNEAKNRPGQEEARPLSDNLPTAEEEAELAELMDD